VTVAVFDPAEVGWLKRRRPLHNIG